MKFGRLLGLGVALALVSTSALGFEEQKAAAPQASQPEAPAAAVSDGAATPAPAGKSDEGTEVRIPGLGKLGVLPKMDFGLELLYGANEPKAQVDEREVPADELTIRGSVKKSF
jgi:hypothetical protein